MGPVGGWPGALTWSLVRSCKGRGRARWIPADYDTVHTRLLPAIPPQGGQHLQRKLTFFVGPLKIGLVLHRVHVNAGSE